MNTHSNLILDIPLRFSPDMTLTKQVNNEPSCASSHICTKPFFNNMFFNIQNGSYEIIIMWSLLIITIFLILTLYKLIFLLY